MKTPVKSTQRDRMQYNGQSRMPDVGEMEIVGLALRNQGYGSKVIGRMIGVHHWKWRGWLKRNGLPTCIGTGRSRGHVEAKRPKQKLRLSNKLFAQTWANEWRGVVWDYWACVYSVSKVLGLYGSKTKDLNYYRNYAKVYARTWKKSDRGKEYMRAMRKTEKYRLARQRWRKTENYRLAQKLRRKTSLRYKLSRWVREQVKRVAARAKISAQETRKVTALGCTVSEFRAHLERQFQPGMSWSNYGKWHIDHIKPIASFSFSSDKDFSDCNHYSNLRPLWAADNIARPYDGSDLVDGVVAPT
jgi:hypothetical protein